MSSAPGELRSIQALRAVACLLVIVYHLIVIWVQPPRTADDVWANGAAGVDLFFVISGFVMARSAGRLAGVADGWRIFLERRLCRIVPLYWGLTTVKLAFLSATGHAARIGLGFVLASLLFFPARDSAGMVAPLLGVGWTLQFEMLFYGAVALTLACHRPALAVTPVFAILAVAGFFRRPDWPAPLALANGLVLEFCLGLAVARIAARRPAQLGRRATALVMAGAWLALLTLPPPGPWRFCLWGLPAAALVLSAVRLEQLAALRLPNALIGIGDASYSLYLLHPFVVPVCARLATWLLQAGLLHGRLHLALLLALGLPSSLLGGMLLHRLVEAPVQVRLSRRRAIRASAS